MTVLLQGSERTRRQRDTQLRLQLVELASFTLRNRNNRPSCGITSAFMSVCAIGQAVGIRQVVGPSLILHV